MLIDTGADLSVAPRGLAERSGHDWDAGEVIHMRGVSPKPECQVEGRVFETELIVLPADWRLAVPVMYADADVPLLAGRRGFLDRLHISINGRRNTTKLTLL
jgi:hypothetical protein